MDDREERDVDEFPSEWLSTFLPTESSGPLEAEWLSFIRGAEGDVGSDFPNAASTTAWIEGAPTEGNVAEARQIVSVDHDLMEQGDDYESESSYDIESTAGKDQSTEEHHENVRSAWGAALLDPEQEEEPNTNEGPGTLLERGDGELGPADSIDEAAAQCLFSQPVRDRLEPLLDAAAARKASAWNAARHPAMSGVSRATLLARLSRYVNRSAIESAMQTTAGLKDLSGDTQAVLAVVGHQFQQKIYTSNSYHDGKIGEGTLDALGFVRHRGEDLNAVDALNIRIHVKRRSKAFQRLQQVYRTDRAAFEQLGADVSPNTWYRLFVNAPFLGRPFTRGIHVELMRRLRRAEKWLLSQPPYKQMSPVELGVSLNIDEDHRGGRVTANNSMHTLGLAVDLRYVKNPWVTGQRGTDGKPNEGRNTAFQTVSRNVSRLLSGTDDALMPAWLYSLGSDPGRTTESAYTEIQKRQTRLLRYLSFETDDHALKAAIVRRRQGLHPERVIDARETVEAAAERWRRTIRDDRKRLQVVFGSGRRPEAGFLNLDRMLVCALRDHACLAWGAIDLGPSDSGDMMHFDCRPAGIGWTLSLNRQRTTGANHSCGRATAAAEESETQDVPSGRPAAVSFLGGRRWTFTSRTLPMRIGVFCPKATSSSKTVGVLVYAHGHLDPCPPAPKTMPDDLITRPPFELGKLVDASGREIVLVVPFLDWGNLKTNGLKLEACFRDNMHLLGTPSKLNGVVREVLDEVGRVLGTATPSLQNLILAGHSRAYDFLDPLAMAHGDPEMSKGCLARLSEVWALDTTYTCPTDLWLCWLGSKPDLRIKVFYRDGSTTGGCGKRLAAVARRTGRRLQVVPVTEGHCAVPGRRLPELLNAASNDIEPKTRNEFDERLEKAPAWDVHLPNRHEAQDAEEQAEALRAEHEVEADVYDSGEAEIDAQEGTREGFFAPAQFEAADEELEGDAADHDGDEESGTGDEARFDQQEQAERGDTPLQEVAAAVRYVAPSGDQEPDIAEECEDELESSETSATEYIPDLGAPETGDPRKEPEELGRTDLDKHFQGRTGDDLKTLFRDLALKLQLDPGLLAAVAFAEKHAGTPLLSTNSIGLSLEAHTGADDWFIPYRGRLIERVLSDFGGDFTYNGKRVQIKYEDVKKTGQQWVNEQNATKDRGVIPKIPAVRGSGQISSVVIVVALYLKSCEVFLKDVLRAIQQSAGKGQAYTAKSYRKGGRLKRSLNRDEVKNFKFATFDDLPAEYRFVLLRVAYNHGLGGATDLLFKLGKGGDIKRTGGTQRNPKDAERTAVLHAARALHLSQAVFSTSPFVLEFGHFLDKGQR